MKIKTKRGARRIRNQRVVTRRFVVTDYTGCPYITAGKLYEVLLRFGDTLLEIETNYSFTSVIKSPDNSEKCAHLGDVGTWRYAVI